MKYEESLHYGNRCYFKNVRQLAKRPINMLYQLSYRNASDPTIRRERLIASRIRTGDQGAYKPKESFSTALTISFNELVSEAKVWGISEAAKSLQALQGFDIHGYFLSNSEACLSKKS